MLYDNTIVESNIKTPVVVVYYTSYILEVVYINYPPVKVLASHKLTDRSILRGYIYYYSRALRSSFTHTHNIQW